MEIIDDLIRKQQNILEENKKWEETMIALIQNFSKILRRFMSLFDSISKEELEKIKFIFTEFFIRIKLIIKLSNQNTFLNIIKSFSNLLKTKL